MARPIGEPERERGRERIREESARVGERLPATAQALIARCERL